MPKIKVVVVDDDVTSRNTIKRMLEYSEDYIVTADFSDGKKALEWLRANETDILLCDMQMPEMNGVELMRVLHTINEYLPVIAISAFDDFAFVRGSLINGAANYLLKHELTKEKLFTVLEQVRERYQIVPKERSERHQMGYCIYDEKEFTVEAIKEKTKKGEIDFNCANVMAIAFSPDYVFPENVHPQEYKEDICKAIMDILGQILNREYPYLFYWTREYHLILLLSFPKVCSTLYAINIAKNLINRAKKQIIRLLDITMTVAGGELHVYLEPAIADARRMERLLRDKLYLGGNCIINGSVTKPITYTQKSLPENLWKQFSFEMAEKMENSVDTLNDILVWIEENRIEHTEVKEICKNITALLGKDACTQEELEAIQERLREYETYEQCREEILGMFRQRRIRSRKEEKQYSPVVKQVLTYIESEYMTDVSLEDCAQMTGSSYTYLSRAFKQETGMRFVEYLNKKRVDRAKGLLIRKETSMKEIVKLSGFRNYNYFFKVFKELEGITPSEFMAKN